MPDQPCVTVVDTTRELSGFGDVPHPAIGRRTTRIMVPAKKDMHKKMLDAVQNHNAKVVITDEIGNIGPVLSVITSSATMWRL